MKSNLEVEFRSWGQLPKPVLVTAGNLPFYRSRAPAPSTEVIGAMTGSQLATRFVAF